MGTAYKNPTPTGAEPNEITIVLVFWAYLCLQIVAFREQSATQGGFGGDFTALFIKVNLTLCSSVVARGNQNLIPSNNIKTKTDIYGCWILKKCQFSFCNRFETTSRVEVSFRGALWTVPPLLRTHTTASAVVKRECVDGVVDLSSNRRLVTLALWRMCR